MGEIHIYPYVRYDCHQADCYEILACSKSFSKVFLRQISCIQQVF